MDEIGRLIYSLTQKDAIRNAAKENSLLKVQLHNMQVDANKEKRDYLVRKGTNQTIQNASSYHIPKFFSNSPVFGNFSK